jgi:hypothetical protein
MIPSVHQTDQHLYRDQSEGEAYTYAYLARKPHKLELLKQKFTHDQFIQLQDTKVFSIQSDHVDRLFREEIGLELHPNSKRREDGLSTGHENLSFCRLENIHDPPRNILFAHASFSGPKF